MGKENQVAVEHFEDLQPTNVTGYFSYPITCNGILVSINARGFCRKTNQSVKLLIETVQFLDGELTRNTRHFIDAECNSSTTFSFNGLEYYWGIINVENQKIQVLAGEFLGIRFDPNCADVCLFQPAIVNDSSEHTLLFINDSFFPTQQTHTSLLFSTKCTYNSHC